MFNNFVTVELEANPAPIAGVMLEYLDIDRPYWIGIMYLGIIILVVQCLAVCLLKLLVSKFQ